MTILVPEDQLPQAAQMAKDPYAWLDQDHSAVAAGTVPAFVEITLEHANQGHTMQKLAVITAIVAIATLFSTAYIIAFMLGDPAQQTETVP